MSAPRKVTVSPSDFTKTHITPELRTELNHTLLQNNCVPQIHTSLLNQAQSSGFVEALRVRTLDLLRTGKATSYTECMDLLLAQIKLTSAEAQNGVNGASKDTKASDSTDEPLVVPQAVIEEGIKAVKMQLDPLLGIKHDD